jgi:hypothetical protein
VTDQDGYAIPRAQVMVDSGQVGQTDVNGEFSIGGIPPGSHYVSVTAPDHHVGGKVIDFLAGESKSLRVSLTANHVVRRRASPAAARTSTLYVTVYPYRSGHHRYGVKQVEIYGYRDPSKHWTQYCWNGHDGPMVTVSCSNATLGDTYVVHVTWRHRPDRDKIPANDEVSSTFYRKFTSPFQSETIYNP